MCVLSFMAREVSKVVVRATVATMVNVGLLVILCVRCVFLCGMKLTRTGWFCCFNGDGY